MPQQDSSINTATDTTIKPNK